MVIRYAAGTIECGGAPMVEERPASKVPIHTSFAGGTVIGKRYVDAAGTVELLCVKAGKGALSLELAPLTTKDAKPLPSSD